MQLTDNDIYYSKLMARRITGTITEEQCAELEQWLDENPQRREQLSGLFDADRMVENLKIGSTIDVDRNFKGVQRKINVRHRQSVRWIWAAAVVAVLIVGGGVYVNRISTRDVKVALNRELKPGQPFLVTSDGTVHKLTDARQSLLVDDKGEVVTTSGDTIACNGDGLDLQSRKANHKIVVPRSSEYAVTLSDGTRVKINAGSSLEFPTKFESSSRRVFLEGEAYFEVSKSSKPFIVHTRSMDVVVKGTQFNVSAYDNALCETTLVSGSVEVATDNNHLTKLKPNQKLAYDATRKNVTIQEVDPNIATAWVRGEFQFCEESLESIMEQLERWYDIECVFKNDELKTETFNGQLSRNMPLKHLLEMFEYTHKVQFHVEGHKIAISKE